MPGSNIFEDVAVKAPVRLASTTGNLTLSGLQTIDGVALAAGNRVLVWQQSDATTNGIYNASSGPWTRAVDLNSDDEIAAGLLVAVSDGARYATAIFMVISPDPITIGSSST